MNDKTVATAATDTDTDTDTDTTAAADVVVDPNTIHLDEPIKRGTQKIDAVTLRRPAAGELRGVQLGMLMMLDVDMIRLVLPRISSPSLTTHEVNQLDPTDILAMGIRIQSFFTSKAERGFLIA